MQGEGESEGPHSAHDAPIRHSPPSHRLSSYISRLNPSLQRPFRELRRRVGKGEAKPAPLTAHTAAGIPAVSPGHSVTRPLLSPPLASQEKPPPYLSRKSSIREGVGIDINLLGGQASHKTASTASASARTRRVGDPESYGAP